MPGYRKRGGSCGSTAAAVTMSQSSTILLVDDDDAVRQVLGFPLERAIRLLVARTQHIELHGAANERFHIKIGRAPAPGLERRQARVPNDSQKPGLGVRAPKTGKVLDCPDRCSLDCIACLVVVAQ